MALLTIPSITKGTAASVSLNKSDLFALAAVAADAYFSDSDNVKRCVIEFNSDPGNQRKILQFDLSQASPSASLLISSFGRDSYLLERLVLEDNDGGVLILERSELPSGLDISLAPQIPTPDAFTAFLTRFEDNTVETISNLSVTTFGTVQYGTGQFGKAFDSSVGILRYSTTNQLQLGSSNASWTVEMWVKPIVNSFYKYFYNSGNCYIGIIPSGENRLFNFQFNGYGGNFGTSSTVASASWHHIAIVFNNDTKTLSAYLDGVLGYSFVLPLSIQNSKVWGEVANTPLFIGAYDSAGTYRGNVLIDNVRISKGAARYTANFTPPAVSF